VKRAVAAEDWTAAKAAWAKHLESRKSPILLWSHHDWNKKNVSVPNGTNLSLLCMTDVRGSCH
jgi:hypothetical protein